MSVMEARCSACHGSLGDGGPIFGPAGVLCRACNAAPVEGEPA